MNYEEMRRLMAEADETVVGIAPYYVKVLRQLADDIENGKQTGIEGSFSMSHDEPGIVRYTVVTKYNK